MAGTGYALTLPRNSVGSAQLKTSAVRTSDIGSNAVTSAKVKNGALLAADFKAGQLPKGATGATGAAGAPGAPGPPGIQGLPGVVGAITVQRDQISVPDAAVPLGTTGIQIPCPAGTRVIAGDSEFDDPSVADVHLTVSRPFNTAPGPGRQNPPVSGDTFDSWRFVYRNPTGGTGALTVRVYAICVQT